MYLHEIKKSKFIAIGFDVTTKDEVNKHLKELRNEYKDARHICYAYIIENGRSAGMSDDGEPSGTAGKPIMTIMNLKNVSNRVVFVIRYFGGKKLGTGGLIRAYVESAKHEM